MDPGRLPLFGNKGKYFNNIGVMLDGFRKKDPPVKKMLPIEVRLPELICLHGLNPLASEQDKAVGDLSLIAFYYILRRGKYCVNTTARTRSKQCNLESKKSRSLRETLVVHCKNYHATRQTGC